ASAAWAAPLAGTVLDGATLAPVPGARLVVDGTALEATTDASGRYRFDDVAAGRITVRVEAEGYMPAAEDMDLPAEGAGEAVFVLLRPDVFGEVIELTETAPSLITPPGQTDLRREELTRIPGTRGDALTSIKSLPGVANASSGGGLIVIRG